LNVLWGETYRNHFLRFCLPSLLFPDNARALAKVPDCRLVIVTPPADRQALADSPLIRSAERILAVEYIDLPDGPEYKDKFARCAHGYRLALEGALVECPTVFALSPDLIVADGTLNHLFDHWGAGAAALFIPAWRTELEGLSQTLAETGSLHLSPHGTGLDPARACDGRMLATIALDNLHGFERGRLWDGKEFRHDVGMLCWLLPDGAGWVVHSTTGVPFVDLDRLARHDVRELGRLPFDAYPAMLTPASGSATRMVRDSDQAFILSFSPADDMPARRRERMTWRYGLPLLGRLTRAMALRSFVRAKLVETHNVASLAALRQGFIVHRASPDDAWLPTVTRARRIVSFALVGLGGRSAIHATQPDPITHRLCGWMLDALAVLLLPERSLARPAQIAVAATRVISGAMRGDRAARAKLMQRLRLN
jgi:hypothetical protein